MSADVSSDWVSQRIRLAVGQRLLLGLAPALLAVVLVLALAYYGEVGREAPEYVVSGAGLLALISLVLTWSNTRYLVTRLRRLGRHDDADRGDALPMDDLDRIEGEVARLNDALAVMARARQSDRSDFDTRIREHATMLAASVRGMTAQLEEVRLPLHILLEARFGELNENQEELLAAARAGADEIDAALRRLTTVADADRGALVVRREPVAMNDVMGAILPMVRATADRVGARVDLALEPALPRVWANRSALAEALALLASRAVDALASGETLVISTASAPEVCTLRLGPWRADLHADPSVLVATRSLHAQEAQVSAAGDALVVTLPRFGATAPVDSQRA